MAFDEARYEREVLEPARRAGGVPPADLLVRYGLAGQKLDDGVPDHVARVVRHWRSLRHQAAKAPLAAALLAAHEDLERDGPLDGHRLLTLVDRARAEARRRLTREAATLAAAASCVSPATVDELVGPPGGLLDRAMVGVVLRDAGVRVVEPLSLPDVPDKGREIARHLRTLNLRISAEVVFGAPRVAAGFSVARGFRLGAPSHDRLDAAAIAGARERLEMTANDHRKTAAENVLAILRGLAAEPGALDRLLLWEVVMLLRRSPVAKVSQRAVADAAAGLGVERAEAELLGLSIWQAGPADRRAERLGQVEDALAEGRLRAAERLAAALSEQGEAAAMRERVATAVRRVLELRTDAERARQAGRSEQEAALLAEALRLASDDDDLRARLQAIPPPAPTGVTATIGENGVTVRWRPSPAWVGSITYLVVRSRGRPPSGTAGGVAVGRTAGTELEDAGPPAGQSLYHAVFASRDGELWSAGPSAGPNVIAPDVADLRVVADGATVSGTWQARPDVVGVLVARSEGSPPRSPSDGRRIETVTVAGFVDPDVRIGVSYHYLVTAVYGSGGERHASPGLAVSVTPEPAPTPVVDLTATVMAGPESLVVQACWTAPARGATRLVLSRARPPWPSGTVLPAGELRAFGRDAGGSVERLPGGRRRLVLPAIAVGGDCYLTVVTAGRSQAAIGAAVELPMAEPVRELAAQRFGDTVRLSWRWPADSPTARVRWWRPGELGSDVACSRRRYEAQGGFELALGPAAATVSVTAVALRPSGEMLAAPVEAAVEGLAPRVRYAIVRRGWPRRRWTLELTAETACEVPDLVLVRRPGTVMPLRADQGQVLTRIPARRVEPSKPVVVPLEPPGDGPARLRLFSGSVAPPVTLVDPPVRQLVLS